MSIWRRDLFSGMCRECRGQVAAEQERIRQQLAAKWDRLRQEEEAAQERVNEEEIRVARELSRQRREAAMQEDLNQQFEKQQQEHSVSLLPCPDCRAGLVEIKLFGRSAENPLSGAAIDTAVVYFAYAEASRSWGFAMLKEKGNVRVTMCTSCHRIFLHGVPLARPC